ncbi:hypothetical protein C819_04339 [Lachnospiraceae bacterium 10-1]|nr:hypothetical protein C819_04339 [Lachnospiraceae bacterium 10-1]
MDNQEKKRFKICKWEINLHLSLKILLPIIGIFFFVLYIYLKINEYLFSSLICSILELFISSIIIGTFLSYSDLAKIAEITATALKQENEKTLNLWKDQTSETINNIQQKISEIANAFDYIEHVENFPLNQLDNNKLNKLIDLAGNQKINLLIESKLFDEDNKWQEGFQDLSKRYLEQFRKLQQGHLYRTYKREIVLTPNTAKKIIKVHVVLNIIMVTSYTGKTPNYCYTPRFKNKKDAETLKVSAVNNGKSVACNGGELVKRDDHLTREYKIELDSNCRNSLTITSYYCYSLDDTYTFFEAYSTQNPSCEFTCKFKINGPEANKWDIKVDNYKYQISGIDNPNLDIKEMPNEHSIWITKENAKWISEGITCLTLFRKDTLHVQKANCSD